jgi:bloom syndrome protein
MPTCSGKSACFLLPGLVERGITVVVFPLKSVMFDQVNHLKSKWVIQMNHHFNYLFNLLKSCFRLMSVLVALKTMQMLPNFSCNLTQHSPGIVLCKLYLKIIILKMLFFFSPEKLVKALNEVGDRYKLRKLLIVLFRKGYLMRLVIEESNCISLWGTEFR